jgi:hypothetical protein
MKHIYFLSFFGLLSLSLRAQICMDHFILNRYLRWIGS